MSQTITDDRSSNAAIDEAFGVGEDRVPALRPAGPQQVTIDDRPQGAISVAVKREEPVVFRKIKAISAAAGDEFFYRWPVKNRDGSQDWVEGPSVALTNCVARIYGNCSLKVRAFDQGAHWMIQAQFIDLESGYVLERPFQQRKSQNVGKKMDADRALDIVFQIGVSKATRNVVKNALAEFVEYAFVEAKAAIVQRVAKDIEGYRARVISRIADLQVDVARVERQVGRAAEKWLAPDIARLIAEIQTINDGMADADDMWPHPQPDGPRPQASDFNSDEAPARTIAADTPADHKQEPKGAADQTVDAVADAVTSAIEQAKAADAGTLEKLDDHISQLTDANKREDLRRRWNDEGYLPRKNALRVAKQAPPAQAPDPSAKEAKRAEKAAAKPGGDQLADYLADSLKELAKVADLPKLDDLQDRVAAELHGDPDRADYWKNACNERARAIMGRKR